MFEGMFEIFNEDKKDEEETEPTYPTSSSSAAYPASASNTFVVSIGGSVFIDGKPNQEKIAALSDCLNNLVRNGYRFVLVLGGGKVCRDYVNVAKQLGASNFELDEIGIKITRANASLLLSTIENAFPEVLTDVKKSRTVLEKGKTPIYGGLMPGFTTDAVAALLAEFLNATFINLSNVDGIFTADPVAHPTACLYNELAYDTLLEILISNAMGPSQNIILDLPAAMILKRSNITSFFLNGHDLENFKNAVQGMQFQGTVVKAGAEDILQGDEETTVSRPRRRRSVKRKASKRKTVKRKRIRKQGEEEPEEIDPDKIRF